MVSPLLNSPAVRVSPKVSAPISLLFTSKITSRSPALVMVTYKVPSIGAAMSGDGGKARTGLKPMAAE